MRAYKCGGLALAISESMEKQNVVGGKENS